MPPTHDAAQAGPGARRPRRRRRRPRRLGPRRRRTLWTWAVVVAIVVLGILGGVVFDDRHWHAFDESGDAAFARGNYDYAERMYRQALQVARDLDDEKLIAATLRDLSRTWAALGRDAEARAAAAEARQVLRR